MSEFYDRLGVAIDLHEWGRLMEDDEYRMVLHTMVGDILVSTVWLGLDHNFWPGGPVLIFETMVFDTSTEGIHDLEQRRYSTEAAARQGHAEMVNLVRTVEEATGGDSSHISTDDP